MKKLRLLMFLVLTSIGLCAQNIIKGTVLDSDTQEPLKGVKISVKDTKISQSTANEGNFLLEGLPNGEQSLIFQLEGYEKQTLFATLTGKTVNLGAVFMYKENEQNIKTEEDLSTITLTDDELNDDTSAADNISGLLQSSRDVYLRTAAYEWGSSFFRIRGLDSENGKLLINGIEMNKLYNGRPQWSNWGGLNDVTWNQEFNSGLSPSNYNFGGVLGSTNISTRASSFRKGGKFSYASSNRSYVHRLMGTYASGLMENGWSFVISASRRAANEGFQEGTSYNANSLFASLEKQINDKHSLSFTSIYAFNKRGKSAAHTQEAYDLKGIDYNEYWGDQNGEKRNSRLRRIEEPILMLNHYWNISSKTSLNTNVAYQFGEIGNSRLDYNGGTNPSPTYYKKLPSYFLSQNDIQGAYHAQEQFKQYGQINWNKLYTENSNLAALGKNSIYVLYEDRNDDKQITANSILHTNITDRITLNAKLQYNNVSSKNFAKILDLLGGKGYQDINHFGSIGTPERQNDLNNPDRVVTTGDNFKYNYEINSSSYGAFLQGQFKYNKVDFYAAADASLITHQREGFYKNGRFKDNSFGKSEKKEFENYGFKGGLTYKITGRHLIDINGGYVSKSPTLRNIFPNARESNAIVTTLNNEKIIATDVSYVFRSPLVTSKLTGYYTTIKDASNVSFFFLQGTSDAFIQEIMTGIDKKHIGGELSLEAKLTPTIKLKGAVNYGQYTYDNNPKVYLTSEKFVTTNNNLGIREYGKSILKDYKVAAGPQKAYSIGFEYRDPDYWFFTATANYFDDIYNNISPIARSKAFYTDADGLPFADYDTAKARKLLEQEKFDDYFVVNLFGGKSWKISKSYKFIGFTAGIGNVLNKEYKTGGYEQARQSNYPELKADFNRPKRLFGSKYWYGRGTTYFLNIYYRF